MTVPGSPSPSREAHLVELVDADGAVTGSTTVEEAHEAPGQWQTRPPESISFCLPV